MTRRILVHLDAGRVTVRREGRMGGAALWSAATSQQPGEALKEVLSSVASIGHGRRVAVDVVLETSRVVYLRPRLQVESTTDRQRITDDELRGIGLRSEEVAVRWVRDDLGADDAVRASSPSRHLLLAVARDVVDDLERVLRQRRCAGPVGLDLGVLRRLRPILASKASARGGSVAIIADVSLAAVSIVVCIDGRVRSFRVVAAGRDEVSAARTVFQAALEDVPIGSRPSVGHPAARPLECIITGADRTSPIALALAEVLTGGEIAHDLEIVGKGVGTRAGHRMLRAVH
jgi:hypothetical protein